MSLNLNAEQQAAVEATERNILVLAPPGSGKTATLVERVAFLVEHRKVSPFEILLLTFSRKAANEMRSRLEARIGHQAKKLTVSTFHACALQLLHRFGEIIGFKKILSTVYGEWEENFLLVETAKELGYHNGKTWKKITRREVDAMFAKYYQEGIEPDKDTPGSVIFRAFIQRCRENNSYTFGSLLTGMRLLLPEINQYLQWKHIITDESQDTDPLQWQLLKTIQDLCDTTLFSVSDTDQAIYKFRGADTEYLIRHQDEFKIYLLTKNYRSGEVIVKAANKLIAHNQDRIDKNMEATRPGGEIKVLTDVQSDRIVEFARGYSKHGDVAVLSRIHGLLGAVSRKLNDQNIPHGYIGGRTQITNSEDFRRFHGFLKLAVNHFDNLSLLMIKDIIGLSKTEYQNIRSNAVEQGKSHFQVWLNETTKFDFYERILEIYPMYMDEIIDALSVSMDLTGIKHDQYGPVFDFINTWIKEDPTGTLEEYLNDLAVWDISREIEQDEHDIQLITSHGSKGCEWDTVIIAGVNEGIFPHSRSIKEGDESEERRLFFVSVTRAKDRLILTVRPEQSEDYNGNIKHTPASRFIKEMSL